MKTLDASSKSVATNKTTSSKKSRIILDPHPRQIDVIFDDATKKRLEKMADVIWHDGSSLPESEVDRHIEQAVAIIGQSALPKSRLDRAPNLRAVFNVEGCLLQNIDYEECRRRNIHVVTISTVFARPVAEMALGMSICLARRMHEADAAIRNGNETLYGTGDNFDSISLYGKTVSFLGCGNVGRALLSMMKPIAGEILVYDPWIHPRVLKDMGVTPASEEECFKRGTVVFSLAQTTVDNEGKIGKKQFSMMPKGGIFILVSRAGVVNFDEMLDAAESGHIRVGVDVWPDEPIPKNHRARKTPNTMLQAHRGGNIPEVWHEVGRMVADDLELVLQGLPPQRCFKPMWETVSKMKSMPVK